MSAPASLPKPRPWLRSDYERMVDAGILGPGERVELLDGEILQMSPEKSRRHAATIDIAQEALRRAFGRGFVRVKHPIALGETSEPEPDLAVVAGSPRDYLEAHPKSAVLVLEVADSSLDHDRTRKLAAYAGSGLPEHWIVDLVDERLEVYREPVGRSYASHRALERGESLEPVSAPSATVPVTDLLP